MKIIIFLSLVLLSGCNLLERTEYSARDQFKHCDTCPEMIVIPTGEFIMGSPVTEINRGQDESPQREIFVDYNFAVGVFEITFEQWERCLNQKACDHNPIDNGWGRGNQPVTNVSWLDTKQYIAWLSNKTGHQYRLLTEAEWEYVARAGSKKRFWWGDESPKGKAVCLQCDLTGKSNNMSNPVGSYSPNPFGLYDLHGNVWEWVEDCWSENYTLHPADTSAFIPNGECKRRVVRGGAWPNGGRQLRSANRSWKSPNHRSTNGKGFRVAMTLPKVVN